MAYTTKQQQAILDCLKRQSKEPLSATDLSAQLRTEGRPVGLATIYRQLEKLESAGFVHKVNTEEGAYFQYCNHVSGEGRQECLLLKCESCGRILHLDCEQLQPLYAHFEKEHHFRVDHRKTVFSGLCETCVEKESIDGND